MAGNRKKTDKRRIAAIVLAAFLVFVMLFGTIAPFFVKADSYAPAEITVGADFRD